MNYCAPIMSKPGLTRGTENSMSKLPDQTEQLVRRIAGQYIRDPDQVELAVNDVASFLAAFSAFLDFQAINTPSGFRALGSFFVLWKDNRENSTAKKREAGEQSCAALDKLDEELSEVVTCDQCNEDKPKVETRQHGKRVICFECRPLFAVKG